MTKLLETIHAFVWGAPALVLILGVGLYLSFRTRFAQIRLFPQAIRSLARTNRIQNSESGTVSPFRALCTALAATVGTGNLAGVAGAIAIGGPGAVFWMWVSGILGMITKFAEATLAVRFRIRKGSDYVGGPMYLISQGIGKRYHLLAFVYSFFGVVAAFGVGNATQVNALIGGIGSAVEAVGGTLSRSVELLIAALLAVLITALMLGGVRRIGSAAEAMIPFASVLYILLCLGVLIVCREAIPSALYSILVGAFSPRAVTGGMVGSGFRALRVGMSRGVFTNEAGMGTASIAHAAAKVSHPVEQGLLGIVEVFLDTIIICTMTALVILCSGISVPYGTDEGILLTSRAFSQVYGSWVTVLIALLLVLFSLATVLGWGLYGARCAQHLFGEKAWKPFVFLQAATVLLSTMLQTGTVWLLSEIVNGLMAIPNLIALAALSSELVRLTLDYQSNFGGRAADGGTYEDFYQCKPVRTVPNAKVSSSGGGGRTAGEDHLSSEHRTAGSGNTGGLL